MIELDSDVELLTREDLNLLHKKLEDLEFRFNQLREQLIVAKSYGDLRENSDFTAISRKLYHVEQERQTWNKYLKNISIWKGKTSKEKVHFSSKVSLIDQNQDEHFFELVSKISANPIKGKIYYKSPVGKALIGKTEGSKVEVWEFKARIETIN